MTKRSFASDNNAGVHPEVIEAVKAANDGHVVAYGDDPFTARAIKAVSETFRQRRRCLFRFWRHGRKRSRAEGDHEIVPGNYLC